MQDKDTTAASRRAANEQKHLETVRQKQLLLTWETKQSTVELYSSLSTESTHVP